MSNARYSSKIVEVEQNETVPVMLMKSMIVKIKGEVTGKQYVFNGAGSIVQVDQEDINGIINKNRIRQSCCGSYSSPYFSLGR